VPEFIACSCPMVPRVTETLEIHKRRRKMRFGIPLTATRRRCTGRNLQSSCFSHCQTETNPTMVRAMKSATYARLLRQQDNLRQIVFSDGAGAEFISLRADQTPTEWFCLGEMVVPARVGQHAEAREA